MREELHGASSRGRGWSLAVACRPSREQRAQAASAGSVRVWGLLNPDAEGTPCCGEGPSASLHSLGSGTLTTTSPGCMGKRKEGKYPEVGALLRVRAQPDGAGGGLSRGQRLPGWWKQKSQGQSNSHVASLLPAWEPLPAPQSWAGWLRAAESVHLARLLGAEPACTPPLICLAQAGLGRCLPACSCGPEGGSCGHRHSCSAHSSTWLFSFLFCKNTALDEKFRFLSFYIAVSLESCPILFFKFRKIMAFVL